MSKTTALEHTPIDQLDPKEFIIIKGARVNNLKNLSVAIPRNKLVVVTGLSGSGNHHWHSIHYLPKVNECMWKV